VAAPAGRRPRAARLDPDTRRALIADAATELLAEHDPLLVTFDQVAEAAGVSRALVHAYLGDRRGLIDAVQVQIIGRLDTWVGHGLGRATTPASRWRAIVQGTFAFVEAEQERWGVLGATGGLDHPALHGVRRRWALALVEGAAADRPDEALAADGSIAALLLGVGPWVNRGIDPDRVERAVRPWPA
jgi:AcrR family transcriptional regulator